MKLIGKFREYYLNEILLYAVPPSTLETIINKDPTADVKVKEFRIKTFTRNDVYEETKFTPDGTERHQVLVIKDLGFLKLHLYSMRLDAAGVKRMGLKPDPAIAKKEVTARSVNKLAERANGTRIQARLKTKKELIEAGLVEEAKNYPQPYGRTPGKWETIR